jgi:flagellar basal-body rod protein FlgB
MSATHVHHIRTDGAGAGNGPLLYRNPYQPTLDGNTVEAEVEQGKFAENAVQYQASLMFLSGKIRGLREAIKGGA